jgi:hypothetical protein
MIRFWLEHHMFCDVQIIILHIMRNPMSICSLFGDVNWLKYVWVFSEEEVQMAKNHMKKLLTIPGHKGNANQNHLTPVRIVTIKNTNNNQCWWGCGEKGTLIHCWWQCKVVQPLWKTIWRLFKLKIDFPYDPAIPLLGIYQRDVSQLTTKAHPCLLQHYSQ